MPRLHYGNATLVGLPEYQHRRLQSVLNAAAILIYRKSRCQHVTPLLRELYWLRSRERVGFKLAVFILRCLHGLAPSYLSDDIRRVADTNRRRRRSSSSALLTVRPTRLVTMGDRAFPVAGCRLWNSLPHAVTSDSITLPVFYSRLSHMIGLPFPAVHGLFVPWTVRTLDCSYHGLFVPSLDDSYHDEKGNIVYTV